MDNSIIKVKPGTYVEGLKVTSNANDAVNGQNSMTSTEDFYFNPISLYNTETNSFVTPGGVDLSDPAAIQAWIEENPGEYAMLLGQSMEEADGYMSIDDYIKLINPEEIDEARSANTTKHDPDSTELNSLDQKQLELQNNGVEYKETPYDDKSTVLRYEEGNEKVYLRYDSNGTLTNERRVNGNTETITLYNNDGNSVTTTYENVKNPEVTYNNNTSDIRNLINSDSVDALNREVNHEITFNGHNAQLKRYYNSSEATIYYNDNGVDTWLTYDQDGNLLNSRQRYGDQEAYRKYNV